MGKPKSGWTFPASLWDLRILHQASCQSHMIKIDILSYASFIMKYLCTLPEYMVYYRQPDDEYEKEKNIPVENWAKV